MPVGFSRGSKGQSGYVEYGVADYGYAVFLFSRHYWRILADFFIGFKDCFTIGNFKHTHTNKVDFNRNVLSSVLVFGAVKDFNPCYQPIDEFGCQFL